MREQIMKRRGLFNGSLQWAVILAIIMVFVSRDFTDCASAASCNVGDTETFGSAITVNEDGDDADSRMEGDTDANLVYLDAGNDRVGIGTAAPGTKLDVSGTITATGLTATSAATFAGATVADGGSVTTVDINGGTVDGATIGGASPGAITGTTITANSGFTAGGNSNLQNNELNNIGLAGTDITATTATFDQPTTRIGGSDFHFFNAVTGSPGVSATSTVDITGSAGLFCSVWWEIQYVPNTAFEAHGYWDLITVEDLSTGGGATTHTIVHNDSSGNFQVATGHFVVSRPSNSDIRIVYTNNNVSGNNNIAWFVRCRSTASVSVAVS